MKKLLFTLMTGSIIAVIGVHNSEASLLSFNELVHGEIVNTQYVDEFGLTIVAKNFNESHDLAVSFDTTETGTADPDLEDPWSGGNIDEDVVLRNILIINENDAVNGEGIIINPDDEGSRPAGYIKFAFDELMDSFGFDFVDVDDENGENPNNYRIKFYKAGANVGVVTLGDFMDNASIFYDPTVDLGDNHANHYQPITAAQLGSDFDTVKIKFGGSGGIDNINFTPVIPEPASMLLFGSGMFGMVYRRRLKK